MILVTGPPRSGIALVSSQLSAHPDALLLDGPWNPGIEWLRANLPNRRLLETAGRDIRDGLREIHGSSYPIAPTHLIMPVHDPISDQGLENLPLQPDLAPHCHLIVVSRRFRDTICSLARFPHLYPDLPDPHTERSEFLTAAEKLIERACSISKRLRRHWERAGFPVHELKFEDLVTRKDAATALLKQELGMRVLYPEELPPKRKGISRSVCCRERGIDASSLDRWLRQLPCNYNKSLQSGSDLDNSSHDWAHPTVTLPPEPLEPPVILTGRGGSGTRLLAEVMLAQGVDLGHSLNRSLDSLQWVDLLYEITLANLAGHTQPWAGSWSEELRHRARWHHRHPAEIAGPWGFKLPEAMLVGHELMEAWPTARVIHLVRHPLDVCLRRTHMTSRMTNPIGKAILLAAYQALGMNQDPATDPPHMHNAVSWWFQLERMQALKRQYPHQILEVCYEDLCDRTNTATGQLCAALELKQRPTELSVDTARRRRWQPGDQRAEDVWRVCGELAALYGYKKDGWDV